MSEQLNTLNEALRDASLETHTRRRLLERVAIGAAGATLGGLAGPASDAFAAGSRGSVREWGVFAATTEAFTVTLLPELLRRVSLHPEVPPGVASVFDGAYAAELDHWRFIRRYFRPSTERFWIPDAVWGGAGNALDLTAVGHALVAGETLFVNTYLIGVTVLAAAGRPVFARYAAELAGVESEHRVLAQTLINASPPNDYGFSLYGFSRVRQVKTALEGAGIGLGKRGATPGAFYRLAHPPMKPPIHIASNRPR